MKLPRLLLCSLLFVAAAATADEFDDTIAAFRAAEGTAPFFARAYAYAVFPTVGKGGIGIGAAYGKGRVYRGGKPVGKSSMSQISIGLQLGGQAYSQVIFLRDKAAFERFTTGSFEFGAEASAVALTAGAQARAGTTGASASGNESGSGNAKGTAGWTAGMAVFTLAKGGLMYEASIGGQKFKYEPL